MPDAVYFDLTLTPNRSFNPKHVPLMLGGVVLVLGLAALRFLMVGAWMVLPFLLADVALLAWAFRASYRSGHAYEEIALRHGTLTVRKVSASGAVRAFAFEPLWTRVQLETLPTRENRLWLASRGKRLKIGYFLSPPERAEIHAFIADGLARYRAGMPSTSVIA